MMSDTGICNRCGYLYCECDDTPGILPVLRTAPLFSNAATGGSDDWWTPPEVLDRVRQIGPIALDPCAPIGINPVGATRTFSAIQDGLKQPWYEPDGLIFVNPPYSESLAWLTKCGQSFGMGIIALVAARTDTRAFHKACETASAICFWKGRLTFIDGKTGKPRLTKEGKPNPATFPSCLFFWGSRTQAFENAFASAGVTCIL